MNRPLWWQTTLSSHESRDGGLGRLGRRLLQRAPAITASRPFHV